MNTATSTIRSALIAAAALAPALIAAPAVAQTYTIAGPVANNPWGWSYSLGHIADFRDALEKPENFGPDGVVTTTIQTVDLNHPVTADALIGADAYISPYFGVPTSAATTAIIEFFLTGGDLILFNDASNVDDIAEELGVPVSSTNLASNDRQITGSSFPFEGPFGSPDWVSFLGSASSVDEDDVLATNGTVLGRSPSGLVTIAYWPDGAYAPDAGEMLIVTDVDTISTYGPADYDAMNFNAMFALNIVAHMSGARPAACNAADLNEDGLLDLHDVSLFINSMIAGCP